MSSTSPLPNQKLWPNSTLLAQGAEGRVYLVPRASLLDSSSSSPYSLLSHEYLIYKHRLSKSYRHRTLDASILSSRIISESRNILRALQCGIQAPFVFRVDVDAIWLEYIDGSSLRNLFDDATHRQNHVTLCHKVGRDIARMHQNDLIHGDLTTSNIMVRYRDNNVDWDNGPVFIDFGLSYVSAQIEDKAVDLYVLERAILSTHKDASELLQAILAGYEGLEGWGDEAKRVVRAYEAVRLRGRKREMVG